MATRILAIQDFGVRIRKVSSNGLGWDKEEVRRLASLVESGMLTGMRYERTDMGSSCPPPYIGLFYLDDRLV